MKADCWVLGKIFYEMNKGFWEGDCIEDWEGITPVEQELIKSLIDYKPASRISAREALDLKIFKAAGDEYLLEFEVQPGAP